MWKNFRNEDDDKESDVSTKYVESIHWKTVKFGSNYKLHYILLNDCNSFTEEIKTDCQY
jgi:hypothetical protein